MDLLGAEHLLRPPAARSQIDRHPATPAAVEQFGDPLRRRGLGGGIDPERRRFYRFLRCADDRQHQLLVGLRIAAFDPIEGRHFQPMGRGLVARPDRPIGHGEPNRSGLVRGERGERGALQVVRERVHLVPAAAHDPSHGAFRQLDDRVDIFHHADQLGRLAAGQPGDERSVVARLDRRQEARRSQDVADRVELDEEDALLVFRDMMAGRAFGSVRLVEHAGPRGAVVAAAMVDHASLPRAAARRPRPVRLALGGVSCFGSARASRPGPLASAPSSGMSIAMRAATEL
jgi:hypothetical protein